MTRFRLAPMSPLIRTLTVALYGVPLLFVVLGALSPNLVRAILWGGAAFIVVVYGVTWLWLRPSEFQVSSEGLGIRWPMWSRLIPATDIASAELLDAQTWRAKVGFAMRLGAGGLWGAFGFALTSKGMLELWVSRTDRVVVVRRIRGRALLLTPEDPETFVQCVESAAQVA